MRNAILGLTLVLVGNRAMAMNCPELFAELKEGSQYFALVPTPKEYALIKEYIPISREIDRTILAHAKALGISDEQASKAKDYAGFVADELFKNSSRWGNRFDPAKQILIQVRVSKDGITIVVSDQGKKAFNPLTDPGSHREGEDYNVFLRRRNRLGKPVDEDSEGTFWNHLRSTNYPFAYDFEHGNRVAVRVPWTADLDYWARNPH